MEAGPTFSTGPKAVNGAGSAGGGGVAAGRGGVAAGGVGPAGGVATAGCDQRDQAEVVEVDCVDGSDSSDGSATGGGSDSVRDQEPVNAESSALPDGVGWSMGLPVSEVVGAGLVSSTICAPAEKLLTG